ncbi:MAG: anhydro-N-acetylmuramic acid kinase [Ignavibacteria bacterium]|nr:anhydro-N-acetylmuramic acid kinase [Ignavibacteria bacterium]
MEKSKLVVGLMSGTSLDGVDAVLLRVTGKGVTTKFEQLAFVEHAFPRGLRKLLLRNSAPETSRVDDIARLNFFLAELYAEAVKRVARRGKVRLSQIALVGSHGQTIQHLPRPHKMLGRTIRSTLQVGDPSVVATLTGVLTIGDFRVADMAVGGQGAPLVPYFDWLVFRSSSKNRILLNVGGIANMTVLPKNCSPERVYAFDTGPGNMIVDALMHEFYGKRYDHNGKTAARGMVSLELLERMAKHPYLKARPPKSTGREEFGREYVNEFLKHARRYDRQDIIATAAQFTAYAVYDAYRRFVEKRVKVDEVIVSGGGAKNTYIVDGLRRYFGSRKVKLINEFGISSDAKEAICFAILANETMAGRPTNLPRVTGAKKRVVLGKICRP